MYVHKTRYLPVTGLLIVRRPTFNDFIRLKAPHSTVDDLSLITSAPSTVPSVGKKTVGSLRSWGSPSVEGSILYPTVLLSLVAAGITHSSSGPGSLDAEKSGRGLHGVVSTNGPSPSSSMAS